MEEKKEKKKRNKINYETLTNAFRDFLSNLKENKILTFVERDLLCRLKRKMEYVSM